MASTLLENWGCIDGSDGFDEFEVLETDGSLLMSLLDEEEGESCDDERLTNVMRSLEAEISPIIIDGNNSVVELEWGGNWDGCHNHEGIQMNDQDWSTQDGLDFNWMELADGMANVYNLQPCEEYGGGVGDYSQISAYGLVPLEEHGYASSLWQETNASFL